MVKDIKKIEYDKHGNIIFKQNSRMKGLDKIITPLELELYELRCNYNYYDKPDILSMIRKLRKKLSSLDREYWDISLIINKKWHNQKPLWKKILN